MALYQQDVYGNGDGIKLAEDDDSGADANAEFIVSLRKGKRYVLRVRLYWKDATASPGVKYEIYNSSSALKTSGGNIFSGAMDLIRFPTRLIGMLSRSR